MALYDELKSRLAYRDDPDWDSRDIADKVLTINIELSTGARTAYRKLRGDVAGQAELAMAIKRLHDEEIAPLDLPGVGPWAESFIDANLGTVLAGLVGPADAALDKVLPTPVK